MVQVLIRGTAVDVGEEFLNLSSEDKQKTVNEIAAKMPEQEPRVGEATKRGFMRGASFDFYDEMSALARAGGLDPQDPDVAHALKSLFVGGYRKFKGDPEAEKLYAEELARQRQTSQSLEEQHPYATLGGQLGGGLAIPIGAAARVPTMASRAAAAAKTGAVVGGLTGFGAGEGLGGSVTGAAIGAPLGAAAGGALSPVTELGVQGASRLLERPINVARGMFRPEDEMTRRIGVAGARDTRIGNMGLSPEEYVAAQEAGLPVATVDRLGTTGRALARSAADTSPEARAALERATQGRFETQGERTAGFVRQEANYPNVEAQQRALDQTKQAVNSPAYRRAYAEGNQVWSDELGRLAESDEVRAAMLKAQKKAQSRAVEEGRSYMPLNATAVVDDAGQLTMRSRSGAPTYPDLRYWDYTRRELDQMSQQAYRAGARDDGARLASLARQMNTELDNIVPSYQQARAGAARFFGAEDALDAGRNFVGGAGRYELREARRALASMSDTERRLFQDGYADRLAQMLEKTGDSTNVLNRFGNSPAAREELEIALGRDGAARFMARRRVENIMDRMRGALGGSQTARNLAQIGLAGSAAGGIDLYSTGDIAHAGTTAGIVAALRHGSTMLGQRIDQRVVQRVGEALASPDQTIVERGIAMITNNEMLMRVLQAADNATARMGAQQSQRAPAALTGE